MGECLFDLVHQRFDEIDLAEGGKIIKHRFFPQLVAESFLAAITQIHCPRLVGPVEENPQIPVHYEVQSTEPLELDSEDTIWMEPS